MSGVALQVGAPLGSFTPGSVRLDANTSYLTLPAAMPSQACRTFLFVSFVSHVSSVTVTHT